MFSLDHIRSMLVAFLYSMPAIIVALSFHEFSHGLCAYALGDPTAKNAGRLTLNPLRHFDPLGLILLIVIRFGWAKPVPINSAYFKREKTGIVLCSLAGPLANLLLAFLSLNLTGLVALAARFLPDTLALILINLLNMLASYNIVFAVFNLIPISPLDGSKVLYAFLPRNIYYKILRYEQYGMVILIALMLVGGLDRLLTAGVQAVYGGLAGLVAHYIPALGGLFRSGMQAFTYFLL